MDLTPDDARLPAPRWLPRAGAPPAAGECHLWLVKISLAPADFQILDTAEREQLERFRVDSARQSFLASRTLQRIVAAHYTGRDPREVIIDRACEHCGGGHGRPRALASAIDYSVSHSGDTLVIAVVGSGRIGIDIEYIQQRATDLDNLAKVVLTPQEMAGYRATELGDRPRFFYRLWTRKEAVVKLTGRGLAQPVSEIDVLGTVVPSGMIAGYPSNYHIHLRDLPSSNEYPLSVASSTRISVVRRVFVRDSSVDLSHAPAEGDTQPRLIGPG